MACHVTSNGSLCGGQVQGEITSLLHGDVVVTCHTVSTIGLGRRNDQSPALSQPWASEISLPKTTDILSELIPRSLLVVLRALYG